MAQSLRRSEWVLRLAAAGVILAVGTILSFPFMVGRVSETTKSEMNAQRRDQEGTEPLVSVSRDDTPIDTPEVPGQSRDAVPPPSGERLTTESPVNPAVHQETGNQTNSSKATPSQTPEGPGLGRLEQELLSSMAPLLQPGEDTTAVENITPNIRKLRLNAAVNSQIARFQNGLGALDQLASCAGELQKRIDLLARMWSFANIVRSSPAGPLWERLSSRPPVDYGRVDRCKQDCRNAIDRLKEVQESGFRTPDDPRLDVRTELNFMDDTVAWAQGQIAALHVSQRDLDRAEFTVWTKARELPPAESASPATKPAPRQVVPNLDVKDHVEMIATVRSNLDALRNETMVFLRSLPKAEAQVQAFLAEEEYRGDSVAAQWAQVSLVSGKFLKDFHIREAAVDLSEQTVLTDRHYTPSIVLAPVVEANQWARKAMAQSQERRFMVSCILKSIEAAPAYAGDGYLGKRRRTDGRGVERDQALIANIAARRKLFARHSYAITFDRPANRYNWAMTDIVEPYLSYDYWWRWATDAEWYRGSDVRLDSKEFPKDGAATRKLWREFRSIVDAEGRLDAKAINAVLKKSKNLSFTDGPGEFPGERVKQYWAQFFLPDELVREVGYRRPPTPDADTARLLDEVAEPEADYVHLSLPWPPDPYTVPRVWRWRDNAGAPTP